MLGNVLSFIGGMVSVLIPALAYMVRLETRLAVIETKLNTLLYTKETKSYA